MIRYPKEILASAAVHQVHQVKPNPKPVSKPVSKPPAAAPRKPAMNHQRVSAIIPGGQSIQHVVPAIAKVAAVPVAHKSPKPPKLNHQKPQQARPVQQPKPAVPRVNRPASARGKLIMSRVVPWMSIGVIGFRAGRAEPVIQTRVQGAPQGNRRRPGRQQQQVSGVYTRRVLAHNAPVRFRSNDVLRQT